MKVWKNEFFTQYPHFKLFLFDFKYSSIEFLSLLLYFWLFSIFLYAYLNYTFPLL